MGAARSRWFHGACAFSLSVLLAFGLVPLSAPMAAADEMESSAMPQAGGAYDCMMQTTGSGLGFSVSWDTPLCNEPMVFHLEGKNGSGDYLYYLNAVYVDDPGYLTEDCRVVDPSKMGGFQRSKDIPFTFYASGVYDFMFYVMDRGNNTTERLKVRVTVRDPAYPSIGDIADSVAAECLAAGNNTDFEKALWLHDWIIENCEYDNSFVYCGAEGALARGTGTCESYHRAYVMLLNRVGIATKRIEGNGHVWTGVRMDGQWYQVDATWDDGAQTRGFPDESHLYFGMNDHIVGLVHSDYQNANPQIGCNSLDSNYFIKTRAIDEWSQPYLAPIAVKLEAGETLFDVAIEHDYWPEGYLDAFYNVIAYDLSQREWVLNDGMSVATIDVAYANKRLSVSLVDARKIDATMPLETIPAEPAVSDGLVFNGGKQLGVTAPAGAPYMLSGDLWATDAGGYVVTATPKFGYAWDASGDTAPRNYYWTIGKKTLLRGEVSVLGLLDEYVETGSPIVPGVTVKCGTRTLTEGKDYTLSGTTNVLPGVATLKIIGAGNYEGADSCTFSITEKPSVPSEPEVPEVPSVPSQPVKPGGSDNSVTPSTPQTPSIVPAPNVPAPAPNPPTSSVGSGSVSAVQAKPSGIWKKSGGRWWYRHPNGSYTRNGWEFIDGSWYHFDRSGWMQTGWLKTGGKWYYLSGSGAMKTGWVKLKGTWYYLKSSGAMATGWYKVGSSWYWSNSSGAMAANRWVGNYYLKGSGAMATNQWIGRYHVNASGKWDKTR